VTTAAVLVGREARRKHDTHFRLHRLMRHSFGRRLGGQNDLADYQAIWREPISQLVQNPDKSA